jgi:hypothetical protein
MTITVEGLIARAPMRLEWDDGTVTGDDVARDAVADVIRRGDLVGLIPARRGKPSVAADTDPRIVGATLAAAFDGEPQVAGVPPEPALPADAIP